MYVLNYGETRLSGYVALTVSHALLKKKNS